MEGCRLQCRRMGVVERRFMIINFHLLMRMMCSCTKSKWPRIHWSLSKYCTIKPDAVLVIFPNLVFILSNHVLRMAVSIRSSSAVFLYAFKLLLNRHSLNFSHSTALSSWLEVRMKGLAFNLDCMSDCDCDCDCISDCEWDSDWTSSTKSLSDSDGLWRGTGWFSLPSVRHNETRNQAATNSQAGRQDTGPVDWRSSGISMTLNVKIHPLLWRLLHPISVRMYTNTLFIESLYSMQRKVQFLPKSGRNVVVCCVDRPCICIVFILYYLSPVNMREQDAHTVHYIVSSKNNDSYHFQHLPSV